MSAVWMKQTLYEVVKPLNSPQLLFECSKSYLFLTHFIRVDIHVHLWLFNSTSLPRFSEQSSNGQHLYVRLQGIWMDMRRKHQFR